MKDKNTAYLIWLFLGIFGGHKFYLGKTGIGILYLFTFGFMGIGWIIDIFTLGSQVDFYNAMFGRVLGGNNQNTNSNNIVVNVPAQNTANEVDFVKQLHKLQDLKDKGIITEEEFANQKAKLLN